MKTACRSLAILFFSLFILSTALAQTTPQTQPPTEQPIDGTPPTKQPSTAPSPVLVTATASSQRVRYISIGEVHQTRLQVFSGDGTQVFDSDFKLGNLIDWQLRDQQGTHLTDGTYLFLVTVKDFGGNLTQKYGTATLESEQVYLEQTARSELAAGEAIALASNKLADALSPVDRIGAAGLNRTLTASADGNTTIAETPAGKDATTSQSTSGGVNISGTGTQNKIAKWSDNAGTLGDSTITEVGGNVGIGTNNPSGQLHIFGTAGQDVFAGMGPDLINGPAMNYGYAGSSFGRGAGFFNVRPDASATAPNPSLRFATGNVQQMIITNTGNVGIGTTAPGAKLEVAGGSVILPNIVSLAKGAQGNQVSFGSPNGETGMTINGVNGRADLRFDGTTLKLVAGPGNGVGPPSAINGIDMNTTGDIGIGTAPASDSKLSVFGNTSSYNYAVSAVINQVGLHTAAIYARNDAGYAGQFYGHVLISGNLEVDALSGGGTIPLCLNVNNLVSTCSSSLRYKKDVARFVGGMDIINHLRPIAFTWKQGEMRDIGLGAEEVEKIEPLLTFRNSKGEIEGVKYNQLSAVFINAFKEQQAQLQQQRTLIEQLQAQINRMKRTIRKGRSVKR
jgi:hypothetical protein